MVAAMAGRGLRQLLALAAALAALALVAAVAGAGVGPNPADHKRLVDRPIEDYRYDPGRRCKSKTPKGTRMMIRWLERHTRGQLWSVYRCEKWSKGSYSLHAERRAIDWALDARDRKLRKQAMKLIRKRLLARDRRGNDNALARRMGVQGLIYDCRAWFASPGGLDRYSYCFKKSGKRKKNLDPTAAHVDHIHIELSKPGSRGKTSFWRSGLR